jgi:hypothetical protein
MKDPGLDGRHRDKSPPKAGEIQQKRSDTLNKKPSATYPAIFPERDARHHEGENREGKRGCRETGCCEDG